MEKLIFDLQRFAKTISLTSGDDYASYNTSALVVYALAGNDTILSKGANVTIYGGAGNDKIKSYGSKSQLNGGAGNDSIISSGDYVTINGGTGNDTISISGSQKSNVIQYATGGGNDKIYNFSTSDTLSISASSYTSVTSGNDVIFTVGTGKITLVGAKGKTINTTLSSSSRDDGSSVQRGKTIANNTPKILLTGTGGNDTITNYSEATNVTITAEAGNDKIINDASKVSINAGAGNDSIKSSGDSVTIEGGKGNDSINVNKATTKNVIRYYSGDGNDLIQNITASDTLSIAGGTYTFTTSGDDVIFSVGDGKITLKGAKNTAFTVKGTLNSSAASVVEETFVITNSTTSLSEIPANYKIIDASALTNKSLNIDGNDLNNSVWGGAGNDNLFGDDGNDMLRGGLGNDSILGGAGNDNLFGDDGNDMLRGGLGNDSILGGAGNDNLFGDDGNDMLRGGLGNDSILGGAGNDTLHGNGGDDTLYGNKGNDLLYGESGNDLLYGNEGKDTLNGGAGKDSLWGNDGADKFIYASGDGQDVIFGFENDDMLQITDVRSYSSYSYDTAKKEVVIGVDSTEKAITLRDFTATTFNINGTNYGISGTTLKEVD